MDENLSLELNYQYASHHSQTLLQATDLPADKAYAMESFVFKDGTL